MTSRTRLLSFGSAAVLIVLGVIAGPVLGGITGEAIAIALVSLGAIAVVSLVFLEVGLSEDRERAREQAVRNVRRWPVGRVGRLCRRRPVGGAGGEWLASTGKDAGSGQGWLPRRDRGRRLLRWN